MDAPTPPDAKTIYTEMFDLAARHMPGFQVKYKDESWFMKLLGFIAKPFCPTYMTTYTTTFGTTVYFPNKAFVTDNYGRAWKILAHELTHGIDWLRTPVRFILEYSLPQGLALLALGAIGALWNPWWLLMLLFILALAPWPAPGRYKWELRGYTMSMAVNYWRYGSIEPATKQWIVTGPMTGWGYYKMGWSVAKATSQVEAAAKSIEDGTILEKRNPTNPYLEVYTLLKALGVTK